MRVSLIAAVAQNGVIGRNNQLPWKLRDDMRFFVSTTQGHTVITGRKNFEAMGRALPRRTNIVISRDPGKTFTGCLATTDIKSALSMAAKAGEEEAFVIGGGEIYALALPYAQRIYRTLVERDVAGDVYFPAVDFSQWTRTELSWHAQDDNNEHPYVIERWDRDEAPQDFRA